MTLAVASAFIARGILAATFAMAAAYKLRRPAETRAALASSGLAERLGPSIAVIEGFTAFGLLMERRTAWAAVVAIAMLTAFSAFIVRQIIRGNTAPCPCFGAAGRARPTGISTLVRNLGLLAIAVIATGSTGATGSQQWLAWVAAFVTSAVVSGVSAGAAK